MSDAARLAFATSEGYRALTADDRLAVVELERRGWLAEAAVWTDPHVAWKRYDGLVVRSCWDYHLAPDRFLSWLGAVEAGGTAVWNPPDLIRWNTDKRYLDDLARAGIGVVPTHRLSRTDAGRLDAFLDGIEWPEVVMKPAVSASAFRTRRVSLGRDGLARERGGRESPARDRGNGDGAREAAAHILDHGDLLVQPFLPVVEREGEWSLVFFDGCYSHAVLKRPASGDFRVQGEWGGREQTAGPPVHVLEAAARAATTRGRALYARVDGVVHEGVFLVMELELIEPVLFFANEPAAPARFADAIEKWR